MIHYDGNGQPTAEWLRMCADDEHDCGETLYAGECRVLTIYDVDLDDEVRPLRRTA